MPTRAERLYPNCVHITAGGTHFYAPDEYTPIINEFGYPAVLVSDTDYSGDTFVLLSAGEFRLLILSWGSCSGCDALQAVDSYAELDALIDDIEASLRRFDSLAAAKQYVCIAAEHTGSHYTHVPNWNAFVAAVAAYT